MTTKCSPHQTEKLTCFGSNTWKARHCTTEHTPAVVELGRAEKTDVDDDEPARADLDDPRLQPSIAVEIWDRKPAVQQAVARARTQLDKLPGVLPCEVLSELPQGRLRGAPLGGAFDWTPLAAPHVRAQLGALGRVSAVDAR